MCWQGLTEKVVSLADTQPLEPLQLTFTALLHKPGLFDLNQVAINASVEGVSDSVAVTLKDEMIVHVTLAQAVADNEDALIDI